MRRLLACITAIGLLSACVTDGPMEVDCDTVPAVQFRNQCYADSILNAQREMSAAEADAAIEAKQGEGQSVEEGEHSSVEAEPKGAPAEETAGQTDARD